MASLSLNTMPDLVIQKIIIKSDWKSILTLRQVSQRLRYFVDSTPDDVLPDSELTGIAVDVEWDSIRIGFVQGNNRMFSFVNPDLVDMAVKYLVQVLRFQKSTLKELKFRYEWNGNSQHFSTILNVLESRNKIIKAKELETMGCTSDQVMCILPYLDSKSLKNLCFYRYEDDISRIAETNQWKSAKNLSMHSYDRVISPQYLAHFSVVRLRGDYTFSTEDVNLLKTTFLKSPNFKICTTNRVNIPSAEQQAVLWGAPFLQTTMKRNNWFFKMSNSDDVLHVSFAIKHNKSEYLYISRMKSEKVPNGAVRRIKIE